MQRRTNDVLIDHDVQFASLTSNTSILHGLQCSGYERPSPIQLKAIPLGRLGLNIIAQAKSGTGKTVVFSVIALENINVADSAAQALILAPTREIAVQIKEVMCQIGQNISSFSCHAFIGGMPTFEDEENLRNCQIAVGTPGRVKGLIDSGKFSLKSIRLVVLDEADKLMEGIFRPQIKAIFQKLPDRKQVLAFSATYDDALLTALDRYVQNPQYVMLSTGTPALEGVRQYYKTMDARPDGRVQPLTKFEMYDRKFQEVAGLFSLVPFYQCIVFLNHRGRNYFVPFHRTIPVNPHSCPRSTRRAVDLTRWLTKQGWQAVHISGGLNQRERLEAMSSARNFRVRVLVSSDLIARGIDIERVNLVVNLDLPRDPETYLHRVGRTGRFGTFGLAVSFVDDEELRSIRVLQSEYGVEIGELPENVSADLFERSLSAADKEALAVHENRRQHLVDHPEKDLKITDSRNDPASSTATAKSNKHTTSPPKLPKSRPNDQHGQRSTRISVKPPSSTDNGTARWYHEPGAHHYPYWPPATTPAPYQQYQYSYPYPCPWYQLPVPVQGWGGGVERPSIDDFIPPDLPF
ncbi:LOW QUALITY PROTEIN: P-loop containing nucleoside triphosphate hydrolase protein [Jimgerdemannia flammicorona]|uniref:RNA helicase n=1 Tax=Jimgerdemannia flammicorona TaxID=994334 RepID=A0A433QJ35_9FUNG|nr:LOW QUALITY PROTEIN: P-loop containing nucleoside triphosphate hydrolase protein [Jimgerdemannia flammicorona]